ncbi:hypothetical protein CFR73_14520 [Novacetimonas maltaceti]|uniref:Uncharacterized protein n=1 Tax=Novacetimonas maltaceti TaxID=1203393 RepID=A0A2S3VY63_9PROT|nr:MULTISPECIES: hypothetical protein [Acetobacteraceae]POF61574.1 hypothetical protein KMAL_27930 [Novacetimonas maltaceti]PYD58602.1 hypothetical protein CFR73_14520 [Novacetimonas maltaceti]GCE89045.1 hypothetical protein MSKU15_0646 [Komagataeibacter diospyri]
MNTDPFRLRVLKAITAALKDITPANGYATDLSDYVPSGDSTTVSRIYRGLDWPPSTNVQPVITLLDRHISKTEQLAEALGIYTGALTKPVLPFDSCDQVNAWHIRLKGFAEDDPVNPTDNAAVLLSDVRKRLLIERQRAHPVQIRQPDPLGMGLVSANGSGNAIVDLLVGRGEVRPGNTTYSHVYWHLDLVLSLAENGMSPYA